MANLTKEYFDKTITGLAKDLKSYTDKTVKTSARDLEKNIKSHVEVKIGEVITHTSNAFTNVQTQLNTIQRQLGDADLPKIKKDQKLIKEAIGLTP